MHRVLRDNGLRVLAFMVAFAAHYVLLFLFPSQLITHTRIVGYPIFANFNIDLLFWRMYVPMLFLPFASFFLYLRWSERQPSVAWPFESRGVLDFQLLRMGRRFFLGGTLALSLVATSGTPAVASFLVGGLAYTAVREILELSPGLAYPGLDTFLSLLTPFVLVAFSGITGMVHSDGKLEAVPWFTFRMGLAFCSVFGAFLVAGRPWRNRLRMARMDENVVPILVGATLVYLGVSSLPGPIPISDEFFHGGESLASARLLLKGWFPWRDLLFIHGLLEDPFRSALGFLVFEPTEWGGTAGVTLYIFPLYFVFYFLFYRMIFRRAPLYWTLVVFLLPAFGDPLFQFGSWQLRFLLYPLVLLTLVPLLARGGSWRALVFSTLLFWQVLLSPEATYLVPALAAVVFLFEWARRKPHLTLGRNFHRTLGCLAVGLSWGLVLAAFLAWHHSLGPFVDYYRIFAEGHRFTGGLPPSGFNQSVVKFWTYMPTAAIFFLSWYAGLRVRAGKSLRPADWTMIGVGLFVILYYQKYLSRADNHVLQPYAVGLPLYFYLFFRFLEPIERETRLWIRRRMGRQSWVTRHPLTLAFLLILVLTHTARLAEIFGQLPTRFQPLASKEETFAQSPHVLIDSRLGAMERDFQVFFARYLSPSEAFFDFTNQPYFFFYLLGRRPSTRYFHVSMAISPLAQRDLISELERERPSLVAMNSVHGLGEWDGISNQVRHYDVSRYLLTHYVPLQEIHGTIFYKRRDLPWKVAIPAPRSGIWDCDWGTVPYFWRKDPSGIDGRSLSFQSRKDGTSYVTEVVLPERRLWNGGGHLEILFDQVKRDHFQIAFSPAEVVSAQERITFRSLESTRKVRYPIEIGSCYQGYLPHGNKLYLRYQWPEAISGVFLSTKESE